MATIVALTSNNWSSTTNDDPWPGGTKPGSGDTVQTDDFVIEIDENISVTQLEATSSGYFTVTTISGGGTRTIAADVLNSSAVAGALQITAATGNVVLVGDVSLGNSQDAIGISNTGILTLTGDVTSGSGTDSMGVYNTGTFTLTGNVSGGGLGSGVFNYAGTIVELTGNVTGGSGTENVGIYNTGTITMLSGDVTGGSGITAYGIWNNNGGIITELVGAVTGGSGEKAYGILNLDTLTLLTGDVTAGAGYFAYGLANETETAVDIDGALICDSTGTVPIAGRMRLVSATTNAMTFLDTTDAQLTLSNDYPAVADVKDNVVYKLGTLTGELTTGGISHVTVVIGGNVTRWT